MPVIALLIADTALAAALTEQLRPAGLPEGVTGMDLAKAYNDAEVAAIVLDDAAADKKTVKFLTEQRDGLSKPVVLLGASAALDGIVSRVLAKPFKLGALMAQLRYQLETVPKLRGAEFSFSGYRLEPQNRQLVVELSGSVIRLTEKETALLAHLGLSVEPVSREALLAAVWGYDPRVDTHTLETHIYQLRRKLDSEGSGAAVLINDQGTYRLAR